MSEVGIIRYHRGQVPILDQQLNDNDVPEAP